MNRTLFTLLLLALMSNGMAASEDTAPPEEAWQWLEVSGWRAIDSLMPIADTASVLVLFRSYQDLHYYVHEQYFRIDQVYIPSVGVRLTGTRVAPVGRSLQEQLLALHGSEPGATPEVLASRLLVSSQHFEEASCPILRARVEKLENVRINAPPVNRLAIHPVIRHVVIKTGMGQIQADLYDAKDPLVKWAVQTFEMLEQCTGKPPMETTR